MFSFLININSNLLFEVILLTKEIVVPGEFLTIEEEFSSGKNTFEDNEGNIYSTKVGLKEFDSNEREVSIKENNSMNDLIEVGAIVTGRVLLIKESFAIINIIKAELNGKKVVSTFGSAKLMISKVSRMHVKSLRDELKVGDVIKAKVINVTKYGVDLTTSYPEFGVIKAYCSNCRHVLGLFDKSLKCSNCGSIERRKLSNEIK